MWSYFRASMCMKVSYSMTYSHMNQLTKAHNTAHWVPNSWGSLYLITNILRPISPQQHLISINTRLVMFVLLSCDVCQYYLLDECTLSCALRPCVDVWPMVMLLAYSFARKISSKYSQIAPYSSPLRARDGVPVAVSKSYFFLVCFIVVLNTKA